MPQPLSGPGVGLPLPQNLYPSELNSAPYDFGNGSISLAPGCAIPIPAGDWYISLGMYCVLQYLNPITGIWTNGPTAAWAGGVRFIKSDGSTVRIANLTACPVGAVVTNAGSGYVQSSTTVVPTVGNSTWQPIVGGQLSLTTISNAGGNYGVNPIVFIPAPPPASSNANGVGGTPAAAYAVIQSGTVSGVSFTSQGSGYPSAPTAFILPDPTDPNINSGITQASITLAVVGAGSIAAILCTNNGASLASIAGLSLTIAGAGTSAAATPVVMQTITGGSFTTAGAGYGTAALLTTEGGIPPASANTTPDSQHLAWRPRPAQIQAAVVGTSLASISTIVDGGLFEGTPTAVLIPAGSIVSTQATIALQMGGVADQVILQPAP